jgi:hypothetical protein
VCVVQTSTTRQPVPHIQDSEGVVVPRFVTDSTEQWVSCFIHMWFMLHVIFVICLVTSLGSFSGSSGSVRIYRRVIFGKQNW